MISTNDNRTQAASQVCAVLLSAGRSRRMGAFKPLLRFGDKTVIESCIENLRQGGIEQIVIVVGHRADEIEKSLAGQRLLFAVNSDHVVV